MLKEIAFILLVFFRLILYGLAIILWLTDETQEFGETLQWSCKSDLLDALQPVCQSCIY